MLLATASVKMMEITSKNAKVHATDMQQLNQSSFTKQEAVLLSIQQGIKDTNQLILAGNNSITSKMADALRLDWLRNLGTELKDFLNRNFAINIAIYRAVLSIQTAIPSHLERGLIEEPFILEDAIGRVAPVHLQFITSWEALNMMLELRFKGQQGFMKIKTKAYGLEDRATQRDITEDRSWQSAFRPGQQVQMSVIFEAAADKLPTGTGPGVTCPGCHAPSVEQAESELQCCNCKLWYRRIIQVEDKDELPQSRTLDPWTYERQVAPPRAVKRGLDSLVPENPDDIRDFKRVRVVEEKHICSQTYGPGPSSYWCVQEQENFERYIAHFGTGWKRIATLMGNKSPAMCKHWYDRLTQDGGNPGLVRAAAEADKRRWREVDLRDPQIPMPNMPDVGMDREDTDYDSVYEDFDFDSFISDPEDLEEFNFETFIDDPRDLKESNFDLFLEPESPKAERSTYRQPEHPL